MLLPTRPSSSSSYSTLDNFEDEAEDENENDIDRPLWWFPRI